MASIPTSSTAGVAAWLDMWPSIARGLGPSYPAAMTRYRRGTPADSRLAFDIFQPTIDDLGTRTGGGANATAADDPETAWAKRRPLFDHIAATADQWWLAEAGATGRAIGYARSILRDGVRELTEFFVLPEAQAGGVGRELLARAFPAEGARHRSIVATIDPRAISRYLQSGLPGKVAMAFVAGTPRPVSLPTDLERERLDPSTLPLDDLGEIDRATIGFRRDEDHRWLASRRPGWLYRRGGAAVAYGYHPAEPVWGGPYAALLASDLPVLLADGETAAAEAGHPTVTFDMALTASAAFRYLLGRGFRVDPFVMLYFTDGDVAGLERYVLTSPPFFV
jgi:GNAT superfamily N-acetyltransferase